MKKRSQSVNVKHRKILFGDFQTETIGISVKKILIEVPLRKATLLCESAQKNENVVLDTLKDAIKIESGNVELDISVFTFYAKYTLIHKSSFTSAEYTELGKQIQNSVAKIEELREQNLRNMDFIAKKNYFATRTELYEVLLMLYAKQNRPFDMLLAINQVRSRAIQDEIAAEKIKNLQHLQKILAENHGMLLAYYVGCDHVWSICFTGTDADISMSKLSGQQLTEMCWNVLQVYSDSRHAQTYMRYGPRYKPVPLAFDMSNLIYKEIFSASHQKFLDQKLKHLYIVPHNILNYLSFSALAVKTDPKNAFNTKFVADDNIPISYLTSANSLSMQETGEDNLSRSIVLATLLSGKNYWSELKLSGLVIY